MAKSQSRKTKNSLLSINLLSTICLSMNHDEERVEEASQSRVLVLSQYPTKLIPNQGYPRRVKFPIPEKSRSQIKNFES